VNDSDCAFIVLFSVYVVTVSFDMWSVVKVPGVLLVLKLSLDKLESILVGSWLG